MHIIDVYPAISGADFVAAVVETAKTYPRNVRVMTREIYDNGARITVVVGFRLRFGVTERLFFQPTDARDRIGEYGEHYFVSDLKSTSFWVRSDTNISYKDKFTPAVIDWAFMFVTALEANLRNKHAHQSHN